MCLSPGNPLHPRSCERCDFNAVFFFAFANRDGESLSTHAYARSEVQ